MKEHKLKVHFDDVFNTVEDNHNEVLFQANSDYQFNGLTKVLLTDKQYDNFIQYDTKRTFNVSLESLEKGINYMKNNPYNKK